MEMEILEPRINLETNYNHSWIDLVTKNKEIEILDKYNYKSFMDLLDDKFGIINWHNYNGDTRLEGSILIKNPPLKIPKFFKTKLRILEHYHNDLKNKMTPFRITKNNDLGHQDLFNHLILMLIDCYPTYCKKDKDFRKRTISSFQAFLEEYPLGIIAKTIKSWIQNKKEYPTIADLIKEIKQTLCKVSHRIERLEKIILITTQGGREND